MRNFLSSWAIASFNLQGSPLIGAISAHCSAGCHRRTSTIHKFYRLSSAITLECRLLNLRRKVLRQGRIVHSEQAQNGPWTILKHLNIIMIIIIVYCVLWEYPNCTTNLQWRPQLVHLITVLIIFNCHISHQKERQKNRSKYIKLSIFINLLILGTRINKNKKP